MPPRFRSEQLAAVLVYTAIGAGLAYGSIHDLGHLWGFRQAAHLEPTVRISIFAFVIAAPLLWLVAGRRGLPAPRGNHFWVLAITSAAVACAGFWVFRSQSHFLGDGYQSLGALGADPPYAKGTAVLTSRLLTALVAKCPGTGADAALCAYRIVAFGCGALFLATVLGLCRLLSSENGTRAALAIGLATGGYSLVFFGYVENYAPLILAVAAFAMTGIAIELGRLPRWAILVPTAMGIAAHAFGLSLVPTAGYLLLTGTRWAERLRSRGGLTGWLLELSVPVGGAAIVAIAWTRNEFVGTLLLPLSPGRYTAAGYTLFSRAHVLDFVSLLVILAPSAWIIGAAALATGDRRMPKAGRFLLMLCGSCLGAVFFIDPKIGMPRDWDLFSFAGVPLVLASYWWLLTSKRAGKAVTMVLALTLSTGMLAFRVAVNADETAGYLHFVDHDELDPAKHVNAHLLRVRYFERRGDQAGANREAQLWSVEHPERTHRENSSRLIAEGRMQDAKAEALEAVRVNPLWHYGYSAVGSACLNAGELAEAVEWFRLAVGACPGDAWVETHLAIALFLSEQTEEAVAWFNRVLENDPRNVTANIYMAEIAGRAGDLAMFAHHLEVAASSPESPPDVVAQWEAWKASQETVNPH